MNNNIRLSSLPLLRLSVIILDMTSRATVKNHILH